MIKRIKNNSGLTAVEVIVAAVILVIVSVSLLGLYNSNFGWIVGAGFRTEAVDEAKALMDAKIAAGAVADIDGNYDQLVISFTGTDPVVVEGELISFTGTDGPNDSATVTLNTFIPK